jgi:hypothetical protein
LVIEIGEKGEVANSCVIALSCLCVLAMSCPDCGAGKCSLAVMSNLTAISRR